MSETYLSLIFMGVILIYVLGKLLMPICKDRYYHNKRKRYEKKYGTETVGEVVGYTSEMRVDMAAFWLGPSGRGLAGSSCGKEWKIVTYSPIIKYNVQGCNYEINAMEFTALKPEVGERAIVVYNPWKPEDACGRLDRSLFGKLSEGEEWKRMDGEK